MRTQIITARRDPRAGRSRAGRSATGTALAAVAVLVLAGCGAVGSTGTAEPTSASQPAQLVTLPDLVGKGLQSAVDQARAAGLGQPSTHDASGRLRAQIIFRDWKVCFQTPGPGRVPASTAVDLAVVKLAETCPAQDQGVVTITAGAVMPDLRGRSARYADQVLGTHASIRFITRDGGDAIVLLDSNWQVCAQQPAPGQPYGGVPVTLTVAKYSDGGCPTG